MAVEGGPGKGIKSAKRQKRRTGKKSIFNKTGKKARYLKGSPKEIDLGIGDLASRVGDKIKGIDLGLDLNLGGNQPKKNFEKPPRTIIAEKGSMAMKSISPETGKSLVEEVSEKAYMDETGYRSPQEEARAMEEYNNNPMKNRTLDKFKKYNK